MVTQLQAWRQKLPYIGGVVLFAVAGSSLLLFGHAQTPTVSVEAESGATSSCTSKVSDTSASSGAAVKFSACGAAGSTAPTSLDASGTTIPDTNYAIPGGAIFMLTTGLDSNAGTQSSPVATLEKAASLVSSGGTIVAMGGTYRDGSSSSVSKNFTLQAYPHAQVWFDGANVEPTSAWTNDGNGQWSMSWITPSFCNNQYYTYAYNAQTSNGPCAYADEYGDSANPAAGDPQMVFMDGTYIHEVTSQAAATGNNFYYNEASKAIYIGFNPAAHTVELAARPNALVLQGGVGGNIIRGIGFREYATNNYTGNITGGAVLANVNNVTFEKDAFTRMAANGLSIADSTGVVINSSIFAANGGNGMTANGHQHGSGATDGLLMENSVFSGNNTERFGTGCNASCMAAGVKISHMDGFTLKNNIFENGIAAKGFWCDLACSNGVMIDNVFKNNSGAGLMYEVGNTGIIASNLIYGNGGEGLKMGSANTQVYNNTIVNNGVNVLLYDDNRSYGISGWTDVGPDTTNVSFANNILYGGGIMIEAWRTSATSPNTGPNAFLAFLDYNSYYRTNGSSQVLFSWKDGSPTINTTNYNSVQALTAAKNDEVHGRDITNGSNPFVSLAGNNYALASGSADITNGGALPANVATVLGVPATAGQTRGAINWPGK